MKSKNENMTNKIFRQYWLTFIKNDSLGSFINKCFPKVAFKSIRSPLMNIYGKHVKLLKLLFESYSAAIAFSSSGERQFNILQDIWKDQIEKLKYKYLENIKLTIKLMPEIYELFRIKYSYLSNLTPRLTDSENSSKFGDLIHIDGKMYIHGHEDDLLEIGDTNGISIPLEITQVIHNPVEFYSPLFLVLNITLILRSDDIFIKKLGINVKQYDICYVIVNQGNITVEI